MVPERLVSVDLLDLPVHNWSTFTQTWRRGWADRGWHSRTRWQYYCDCWRPTAERIATRCCEDSTHPVTNAAINISTRK